jgi:hypothetical protein
MEFVPTLINLDHSGAMVMYNINGVRLVMQMRHIVGGRWTEYLFWTKKHYATRIISDSYRKHLFTKNACIIQSMESGQITCIELELRSSKTPINQTVEQLLMTLP